MEIKTSNVTVESNDNLETKQFVIATNAKAFEILTSTLYKDVPSSIVRELISNAHDGHVRAGNLEKEIEVHAPNSIEPTFEVRDFGCSMDEETMMNIYTSFFSSTKNDSNEEVGGFGLGCKLPFAYTDIFTITTYLNGKKQDYIAAKENGVPTLSKNGKAVETDEPNGVKVCVPVQDEDINLFVSAIEYMIKYSSFKIKQKDAEVFPQKEYDNLGLSNFHNYGSLHGRPLFDLTRIVRVGGVPYSLDTEILTERIAKYSKIDYYKDNDYNNYEGNELILHEVLKEFSDSSFNININTLCYYNGCLDFNVGELDVTASRESLQYSNKTRKALFKRLCELQSSLKKCLEKIFFDWKSKENHTFEEALKMNNVLQQYNWGCFSTFMNYNVLTYSCGNFVGRAAWSNDGFLLHCFDEEIVEKNNIKDCLEKPAFHTLAEKGGRFKHTIYSVYAKGRDHLNIYLTNAPLKYSGIEIDDEEVRAYGSLDAVVPIITVASRSDVKAQGEKLQRKFDEICPNFYKIIVVDKKDCFIPKSNSNKTVNTSEEDQIEIEAKRLIEKMKPISDYFGKLYLFSKNSIPKYIGDPLGVLASVKHLFGIPDLSLIIDSAGVSSRVKRRVQKISNIPVVFFEDEMDEEIKGVLQHELFRKLEKQLKTILFFSDIDIPVKKLINGLTYFGRKAGVNNKALERICEFHKSISFFLPNICGIELDKEKKENALLKLFENFFKRLTFEEKFQIITNVFYNFQIYSYSYDDLFQKIMRKAGIFLERIS